MRVLAGRFLLFLAIPSIVLAQGAERVPKSGVEAQRQMDAVWRREHSASTLRNTALHTAVLREALRDFLNGDYASDAEGFIASGDFLSPSGQPFTAIHLSIPTKAALSAGASVTFFGIVEDSRGQIVTTIEEPATTDESKGDVYVEKSLALAAGSYKGAFGVAVKNKPLIIERVDMDARFRDPKVPLISRLILSRDIHIMNVPQSPTEPFAFGGTKVVPRSDLQFDRNDDLWIFFELINPGIAAGGSPDIGVKYELSQAGAPRAASVMSTVQATALKGFPGHFGVGDTISLKNISPGPYDISVTVADRVSGQTWTLAGNFTLRDPANDDH